MRKLKIYLDTSVISHLKVENAPEKMSETLKFWKKVKEGKFEIFLSSLTLEEINECKEPKLSILQEFISEITYDFLYVNEEVRELAEKIIESGILNKKSMDDCLHIACAVVNNCDYIISWNFKHLVNVNTINGVRAITAMTNYKSIELTTPTILIGGEENE